MHFPIKGGCINRTARRSLVVQLSLASVQLSYWLPLPFLPWKNEFTWMELFLCENVTLYLKRSSDEQMNLRMCKLGRAWPITVDLRPDDLEDFVSEVSLFLLLCGGNSVVQMLLHQ